jgi:hypothetical protein
MQSSDSSLLLARASADDNVVGLLLHGSRARGLYVTEQSDLDAILVVRDPRGEYPSGHGNPVEVVEVTSLHDLPEWMLPALLWNEPLLDRTGEVAEQLRELTTVDPASAGDPLDGFVNMVYRSLKNARVDNALGALLDAQESIPWFLEFVFRIHGRLRPYNKWLEWELREHPLPVPVDVELRRRAARADAAAQHALFRQAETIARDAGLSAVIDGWEPDVAWLRG